MNCLVLGGAGFIGSHIVDALAEQGHRVRVFDLPNIGLGNLADHLGRIDVHQGNFNNPLDLSRALEGMDIVIHLICSTLPGPSNENPIYDVNTNVIGTLHLLQEAVRLRVRKVIFASSGGTVYGPPRKLPIGEDHPHAPICSYGITKLTVERYLSLFEYLHGLDYTVLRLANPYGERQRTDSVQGAIGVFLGKVHQDRPIEIWGDGTVSRDYFHIADLVTAVMRVVHGDTPARVYNIGSGRDYSLNQVIRTIEQVSGRTARVTFKPARKLDVPANRLDITRARTELGWQPRVSLAEGIARTWQWLLSRGTETHCNQRNQ